jgi:hypothetical protein
MISCCGRHNKVKVLSFLALYRSTPFSLDSKALAELVNTSPASMRTLLARWHGWGFVSEHVDHEGNRTYALNGKAQHWMIDQHWTEIVNAIRRWLAELPEEKQAFFWATLDFR